ncbi:type I-E CRISPR-associated protein Cas6/Cse3/CasE [Paracoccus marinaquae]|uniref:Type I-E CRISPR-associated protein Cas6/Cse3/CasE n=1 Tax=Paracoccus marinaquae TaxID=2841926 RepID=A0ABS6AS37_9RHOB|nr:type I-E CRISPR-associated protein Cas6/Cse3/CasE [Paracoccus marinaquae]MBU3032316.1 type I-E CRISPR-associated protein Cas6/Cse3/CasE [Paracoccus marinaquae]
MTLYLSRLNLSRDPQAKALEALLQPSGEGPRMDADHRLIWSAFAGDPAQQRDFLWRSEGRGQYLVLSRRRPEQTPLFQPVETRVFAPDLRAGDRLAFALRANATRTEKTGETSSGGRDRKRHVDLVMDALFPLKQGRAEARMRAAQEVALRWLAGQGARAGFSVGQVVAGDYSVRALPGHRGRRGGQPQFGVLDLTGIISLADPETFLPALAQGFGRAKAFGCGLMLIRRAPGG